MREAGHKLKEIATAVDMPLSSLHVMKEVLYRRVLAKAGLRDTKKAPHHRQIPRIYLDLDDVCNTLSMHFLRLVGCRSPPRTTTEYPVTGRVDLALVANKLLATIFYPALVLVMVQSPGLGPACRSRRSFLGSWSSASDWWAGRTSSSPPAPRKTLPCVAARWDWIHAHFPEWMHRSYAITPRKWFFAQPGSLLVDDNEKNCRLFRKNGGRALLIPRPWNRYCHCCTSAFLVERFGRLLTAQGSPGIVNPKTSGTCFTTL